jgi:uncharacterized membrane protein (UPF0127 family)
MPTIDHVGVSRRIEDLEERQRLRGLIGRPPLKPGEGLLIRPSNSVHCFFMSYPIDVIYVDGRDRVLRIDAAMKPWRIGRPEFGAKYVIELPAGEAARRDVRPGDVLEVRVLDER